MLPRCEETMARSTVALVCKPALDRRRKRLSCRLTRKELLSLARSSVNGDCRRAMAPCLTAPELSERLNARFAASAPSGSCAVVKGADSSLRPSCASLDITLPRWRLSLTSR